MAPLASFTNSVSRALSCTAFEAVSLLLLKMSCGKLLLLRRTWQCPSHPHLPTVHPPPTVPAISQTTHAKPQKKYKACKSLNPNKPSLFISVLIPVMFQWLASHGALCCFKTLQWDRPLHSFIQLTLLRSKSKSHNCCSLSFVRLVQQRLQAFTDHENFLGHGEREKLAGCWGWFSWLWGFGKVRRANIFSFSFQSELLTDHFRQDWLRQHCLCYFKLRLAACVSHSSESKGEFATVFIHTFIMWSSDSSLTSR